MNRITNRFLCTTLAATVLSGTVACTTTPHRTTSQMLDDKETAEAVQAALNTDKVLYARHIIVRADDGVVHLSGYVWNGDDLYEAQRIAESVPGVKKVVDELELERNGLDNSPVTR